MIFVSLGTQDRSFKRLLDAVEKQIELGNIRERVVVQAGHTKYVSNRMEIFDFLSSSDFSELLQECRVLITHGGVGTIIEGLKYHKKMIAAARLSEYGEHQNNHQQQIISEFVKKHYLLELDDFNLLHEKLIQIQNFEPMDYKSNTENFISLLEDYIASSLKHGKGNWYRKFMQYAFYGCVAILFECFLLSLFRFFHLSLFFSICLFQVFLLGYRAVIHSLFFSQIRYDIRRECIFFFSLFFPILLELLVPSFFSSSFLFKMCSISFGNLLLQYGIALFLHIRDVE